MDYANYVRLLDGNEFLYFIDGSDQDIKQASKVVILTQYGSYKLVLANSNNETVDVYLTYDINVYPEEETSSDDSDKGESTPLWKEFYIMLPLGIVIGIIVGLLVSRIMRGTKKETPKSVKKDTPKKKVKQPEKKVRKKKPEVKKVKKKEPVIVKKAETENTDEFDLEEEPSETSTETTSKEIEKPIDKSEEAKPQFCGYCGKPTKTPFCSYCGKET